MGKDSGAKYLFAGLIAIAGLVLVAMFWNAFLIGVKYSSAPYTSIEKVALNRVPVGARVRVEGIVDPRHSYVVKRPGSDKVIELFVLLDDDKPMGDWRDAIVRDATSFEKHLPAALDGQLVKRGIKDYLDSVDLYDSRWNKVATQLNNTIRDAWPNYAVCFSETFTGNPEETGFVRRTYPERNWVLEGHHPAGGPQQRPPWPEEITLSNPIKPREIPTLRAYLDGEVAYYEGAARQVQAELEAFDPEETFGRKVTVTGVVHQMPKEAYDAFEAIDDLAEDIVFYLDTEEELSHLGVIMVPIGGVLVLLPLGLIAFWMATRQRRILSMTMDDDD